MVCIRQQSLSMIYVTKFEAIERNRQANGGLLSILGNFVTYRRWTVVEAAVLIMLAWVAQKKLESIYFY